MAYNRNDFGNGKKQGKKSFYIAACTAIICLLAVGTVYYKTNQNAMNKQSDAELAELPQSSPAGNGAIGNNFIADGKELENGDSKGITEDSGMQEEDSQAASAVVNSKKSDDSQEDKKTEKKEKKEEKKSKKEDDSAQDSVATMSNGTDLSFNEEKGLSWPVNGDVIMKFSQNNTVYFKTLAQYKCNPAIEISAKEGSRVVASATGTVTDISKNEETGTTVTTSIGSNYTVVYGQLKDVKVTKGQSIKEGELIGKVAAPTKYFTEEGSNLYFQVTQNDEAVDPLLLLK